MIIGTFSSRSLISEQIRYFHINTKIFQNELVLGAIMKNEKQSKMFKVLKKIKILRKKFDEQTKGTG